MPSVGDLSSMAIWPILMNWQTISSVLSPAAQCFGSQIDYQDLVRRFLNTWSGFLLAAVVLIATFLHVLHKAWKIAYTVVLNNWSTKCIIPEYSSHYDRLLHWLSEHPSAQSLTQFSTPTDDDDRFDDQEEAKKGVDFAVGDKLLDINQLIIKAVSEPISQELRMQLMLRLLDRIQNGAHPSSRSGSGTRAHTSGSPNTRARRLRAGVAERSRIISWK